jgi:hypothetical protein
MVENRKEMESGVRVGREYSKNVMDGKLPTRTPFGDAYLIG